MPIVLKSGSLNLLEPSGPVQACNEIALTFYSILTRLQLGWLVVYNLSLLQSPQRSYGEPTASCTIGTIFPFSKAPKGAMENPQPPAQLVQSFPSPKPPKELWRTHSLLHNWYNLSLLQSPQRSYGEPTASCTIGTVLNRQR